MTSPTSLDGTTLRTLFWHGLAWLEAHEEAINALNVYPVPDGDTGTNMLFTLRGALQHADKAASPEAGVFLEQLAQGALMGARGNSGVILSQIVRGFSIASRGKASLAGSDIVARLKAAAEQAYQVVPTPTEGTILTVIREAAQAAAGAGRAVTPAGVFREAATSAAATVARTPLLLQVLRENGVVDAGGQGLAILLEAFARSLAGDQNVPERQAATKVAAISAGGHDGATYGFCTEFLVEACQAETAAVRQRMLALGDSVLVVGEPPLVRVHLHTREPETAFAYGRSVGTLSGAKMDNIDAQHQEFAAKHTMLANTEAAVVAVVAGEGMSALFRSLGVAAIVPGGQSMNPSAQEIATAVESVHARAVIVLPNNSNVVLTAQQAKQLAKGHSVEVIPSTDMPQGIAAMMAFNFEADAPNNVKAMARARSLIKSGEVTYAARATQVAGKAVAKGDVIGLVDGKVVVSGGSLAETTGALLRHLEVGDGNAVTLYFGAGLSQEAAEGDGAALEKLFPAAEFSVVAGGQPHYPYLIAVD